MSEGRGAPPQVGIGPANSITRPTTQLLKPHTATEAAE